jgi:hypothetical protein
MMAVMSRHPGETTEQWCTRAASEYREAWAAFLTEWRRVARTGFLGPWGYPLLDEGYDGAMDALDDADNARGEAAIGLDRELHPAGTDRYLHRCGIRRQCQHDGTMKRAVRHAICGTT